MTDVYNKDFFDSHRTGSQRSARVIVPLLLELVQPRSVVDVGCGTGSWLAVFRQHGVEDVLGIDGPHVRADALEISMDRFYAFDLTQPLRLERRFDLVVSLEVAEHLPPESADAFVDSLVSLGPIILFSAAVPGQGGTHHVNEQWPDYWVKLFARHGYVAIDTLRPQVWNATDVEFWYVQNLLLFVAADVVAADARLAAALDRTRPGQLDVVHPRVFAEASRNQHAGAEAYTAAAAEAAESRAKAEAFFAELEQLRAELAQHRSTAQHYIAESAESRAKAEAFFAELEQLKAEVAQHRSTVQHYVAESAESRAKAETFFAELEQLKAELAQHRSTAQHYIAESAESRAKAEAFFAELEQFKAEVAQHRSTAQHYMAESAERGSKAEFYYGESARLGAELVAARTETEHLDQALTSALEEAERWRRRADPHTASLRRVLRELPTVLVSAFKRRFNGRRNASGRSPG